MRTSDWHAVDAERQTAGSCELADRELPVPDRDIVRRLFGTRVIDDGAGMIRLNVAPVATRGDHVPLSVEVNWWLVLAKAVARLYLIAEGNRDSLLASVSLIPDLVPPHVALNVRLDRSTDVRAVVECGDGTLLQVRRWVRVMPHAFDAGDVHDTPGAHLERRADELSGTDCPGLPRRPIHREMEDRP